jgi:nucleoside-diphosphate-sugar epimerase
MKKILITGCSGLVGVHLVKETLERGDYVIGVDIKKSDDLPESEYFKFLNVDLMVESSIRRRDQMRSSIVLV